MATRLTIRDLADPRVFVCTTFGLGLVPKMPGTVTSAVTVVVWWFFLSDLRGFAQLGIVVASLPLAYLCTRSLMVKYSVNDDSAITIDEILGQLVALVAIPKNFWMVLIAFAGFRLLDIAKPDPVGWAERRFRGAHGVLADDIVAGLVVVAVLHYVLLFVEPATT